MSEPIIKFEKINKWYDDFQVLKNINFDIKENEKVVICGPSGSGKSTLIRCINGLELPQSGELVVDGIIVNDNVKNLAKIRKFVGMVLQLFNLFGHLTILDNLTLAPIKVQKTSKQTAIDQAMHYLSLVKIEAQANKYPAQLSGGQQQRAAIARSLCLEPKIMLFDEPTSALDPEMINEVLEVMEMLAQKGMTMVCVTHEMGFAKKVADKVVFMSDGEIIEANSPREFFNNPQHQRTQQFLSQIIKH